MLKPTDPVEERIGANGNNDDTPWDNLVMYRHCFTYEHGQIVRWQDLPDLEEACIVVLRDLVFRPGYLVVSDLPAVSLAEAWASRSFKPKHEEEPSAKKPRIPNTAASLMANHPGLTALVTGRLSRDRKPFAFNDLGSGDAEDDSADEEDIKAERVIGEHFEALDENLRAWPQMPS